MNRIAIFIRNGEKSEQLENWAVANDATALLFHNPDFCKEKYGIDSDFEQAIFYQPYPEIIAYLEKKGVKCHVYGADLVKKIFPPEALKVKKQRAKSKTSK
jgi:hypothetical protein